MRTLLTLAAFVLACLMPGLARAQNPVQWNGNTKVAIDRAQTEHRPLLFWVTEGRDGDDDDDLQDAQSESFRDPIVVSIAQHDYIPVRVTRNSRMLEEAQKLGLPTTHGLYVALVSPEGKLLDQIDPGVVANAELFAERLAKAFREYRDSFYREQLQKTVADHQSSKRDVRTALQYVWRLRILSADADVIKLLQRKDLLPLEKKRLYSLLATLATKDSVEELLTRAAAGDKDAATALSEAEAGALEHLIPHLPDAQGADKTQIAAYEATAKIARQTGKKPSSFWSGSTADERTKETDKLRGRAATVFEYWLEQTGRWR